MSGRSDVHLFKNSQAQAPKLPQQEFSPPDMPEDAESNPSNKTRTPPTLTIGRFTEGDVQMLPTPMVYTPCSPGIPRSPIEHVIDGNNKTPVGRVGKKSYGALELKGVDPQQVLPPVSSARITSEYAPQSALSAAAASTLSQRVTSLSGVEDKLEAIQENPSISASMGEIEDVLTGYELADSEQPLVWKKVRQIGSGNFSDVYLYESLDQTRPYLKQVAVKHVKYPDTLVMSSSPKSPKVREMLSRVESSLTRELDVLALISHPCIIKLYAINDLAFIKEKRPLSSRFLGGSLPACDMFMSYCAGGDLFDVASKNKLPEWLIRRIFTELTMAVKYLHENLVVHRDLKLENILIRFPIEQILAMQDSPQVLLSQHLVELTDFGLCRRIEDNEMCTTRCGSEDYVSPEILMGVPYDGRLSDCWAMGVILYSLLEERLPFDPLPSIVPSSRQRRRTTAHRISCYEWRWLKLANEDHLAKTIVSNCLTRKNVRWNINQVYESEYVQGMAATLNIA